MIQDNYKPELICPAGTPMGLTTAVDAGADAVYVGFQDETNARNFPGLNFSPEELNEGVNYAHKKGGKVFVAINTFPQAGRFQMWKDAVDNAAKAKADAVIIADVGLAEYVHKEQPDLRLHLSVQASASSPSSINYFAETYGVKRVVLPRVLSVPEITSLNKQINCEAEVFVFGGLCVMAEGRCALSSYCTSKSPNMNGVCSPASHVQYENNDDGTMVSKLGEFTINKYEEEEKASYPTICKGKFNLNDEASYIFEEPSSLNAEEILPDLIKAGVSAFKIEGRQRSRAYVAQVVKSFRSMVDAIMSDRPMPKSALSVISEGQATTEGAYNKKWR